VHMALAADRLIAESPRRISDHAEQPHPLFEFGSNFLATYVHRDGVYGIGPRTGRISQARPNRVERAPFDWRAENAWFIAKPQGLADRRAPREISPPMRKRMSRQPCHTQSGPTGTRMEGNLS
jgi:hypothetical protein